MKIRGIRGKKSSYAKATADATFLSEVKCQKQKQQLQKKLCATPNPPSNSALIPRELLRRGEAAERTIYPSKARSQPQPISKLAP